MAVSGKLRRLVNTDQFEQREAPRPLNVPRAQLGQKRAPEAEENVPASHGWTTSEKGAKLSREGTGPGSALTWQSTAAKPGEYLPGGLWKSTTHKV
jgi:hypothetical protein